MKTASQSRFHTTSFFIVTEPGWQTQRNFELVASHYAPDAYLLGVVEEARTSVTLCDDASLPSVTRDTRWMVEAQSFLHDIEIAADAMNGDELLAELRALRAQFETVCLEEAA